VRLAKTGHHWQKGAQRMKKLICLGLVCLGWKCAVTAQEKAGAPAEPVSVRAKALPWLKRSGEDLPRVERVFVNNLASIREPATIGWKAGTRSGEEKLDLQFGHNEVSIPLPEVQQKTTVEVALTTGGKLDRGRAGGLAFDGV
jgi:hypothetical protein